MNCDICHKDTTSGTHVKRGPRFEVNICPTCLMWSDDPRAAKARETIKNFKHLRFTEDISISHEGNEAQ